MRAHTCYYLLYVKGVKSHWVPGTIKNRLFRAKYGMTEKQSQGILNLETEYWFCSLLSVTPCRQNSLDLIKWLRKLVRPYKVVKKISNTNYLVRTPGRRKETQVCHINMRKAYHQNQN